ncbi:hypothetical protein T07_10713 [Trichinella nelsoni]|uniref:FLYWCH-type domain-containing protein n=1 Tax=Trichinella nelsoni TaxID=6336 RepID=A0A0V0RH28_9BILA|nr:hypothetical protein T07_10713 [Trichinella nelsoni]
MANLPELHLVQNRCGGTSLVYEGRAYKLKRAARKKYWRCSQDKKGCGGALIHFFNITISWLPWNSVYKFRNGLFPRYRCIAHLAHDLLVVVKWKFLYYTFA